MGRPGRVFPAELSGRRRRPRERRGLLLQERREEALRTGGPHSEPHRFKRCLLLHDRRIDLRESPSLRHGHPGHGDRIWVRVPDRCPTAIRTGRLYAHPGEEGRTSSPKSGGVPVRRLVSGRQRERGRRAGRGAGHPTTAGQRLRGVCQRWVPLGPEHRRTDRRSRRWDRPELRPPTGR